MFDDLANVGDDFNTDYRIYIEGVQVPFESIHISNVLGSPPTANITMPPWPGLQELGRNYAPKVDVFWRDHNMAPRSPDTDPGEYRDSYKLIFTGIITGTVDSKNISQESGSQSIALNCKHPITHLSDVLIRYSNSIVTAAQRDLTPSADGSSPIAQWDTNTMMVKALMGLDPNETDESSPHYVEKENLEALNGTPGILRVIWNILKRDAERESKLFRSDIMTEMYKPLIEDGLDLWGRLTGHPSIEKGIADPSSKVPYNQGGESSTIEGVDEDLVGDIMVPGVYRSFLGSAAQKEFAITASQSLMNGMGSPESTSISTHFTDILNRLEYNLIVLGSPVSKADGGIIEYILSPLLTSYYAPICNVVLPSMLNGVTVNSNYDSVPSRTVNLSSLVAMVSGAVSDSGPSQSYVSPHSVRYARAGGSSGTLADSMYSYNNVPGKYEYGSGVRAKVTQLPALYNLMGNYMNKKEKEDGYDSTVVGNQGDYAMASKAWDTMYPDSKWKGASKYNPLKEDAKIASFNRLNFMYSDQQFAMETSKARTAQASGVFNPYAIVGYPMDLVDATPSRESYHGLCTSISHTIHASGQASTNYGVSAVASLSELAQYNLAAVNPYLSAAFEFGDDSRIYMNTTAYTKACKIYSEVLGVGAAEPALLQNQHTGELQGFTREEGHWANSESGFNTSTRGALLLVSRNITSLTEWEADRVDKGLTPYIDIEHWSSVDPGDLDEIPSATSVKLSGDKTKIETGGIDAESSPFLDYSED